MFDIEYLIRHQYELESQEDWIFIALMPIGDQGHVKCAFQEAKGEYFNKRIRSFRLSIIYYLLITVVIIIYYEILETEFYLLIIQPAVSGNLENLQRRFNKYRLFLKIVRQRFILKKESMQPW